MAHNIWLVLAAAAGAPVARLQRLGATAGTRGKLRDCERAYTAAMVYDPHWEGRARLAAPATGCCQATASRPMMGGRALLLQSYRTAPPSWPSYSAP